MFLCSLPAPARQNPLERSGRRSKGYLTNRRRRNSGILPDSSCRPADLAAMMAVVRSGVHGPQQPIPRGSRVRRWLGHLFREWAIETWRPIAPAFARPEPSKWSDTQVTFAWLGHSTVLINFFGVTILTDHCALCAGRNSFARHHHRSETTDRVRAPVS